MFYGRSALSIFLRHQEGRFPLTLHLSLSPVSSGTILHPRSTLTRASTQLAARRCQLSLGIYACVEMRLETGPGEASATQGALEARGREAQLWAQHRRSVPVTHVSVASLWKNPMITINTAGLEINS